TSFRNRTPVQRVLWSTHFQAVPHRSETEYLTLFIRSQTPQTLHSSHNPFSQTPVLPTVSRHRLTPFSLLLQTASLLLRCPDRSRLGSSPDLPKTGSYPPGRIQ